MLNKWLQCDKHWKKESGKTTLAGEKYRVDWQGLEFISMVTHCYNLRVWIISTKD